MTQERSSVPEDRAKLPKLLEAYRLLSDTIVQAARERFQKGEIVHWTRRGYRQRGEAHSMLGFQAHNLQLRVLNTATGKVVDLHFYEIEELRHGK